MNKSNAIDLGKLITNSFNESYLFSINGNVFQKISYESLIKPLFSQEMNDQNTLYIIVGTDSGLMPAYLKKNSLKKGSTALFIEFQDVIDITQHQFDLSNEKRIAVSNTEDWEEQGKKFNIEQYLLLQKVRIIKSLSVQYQFFNDYQTLFKNLTEAIKLKLWETTSSLSSSIFIKRTLANLSENEYPVIDLKDKFKAKEVIILAGGPSLDNYIEWVEKHQEHYIIFIISRIARRIYNSSIKPDFILSIDPHPENFEISKEMLKLWEQCTLINYNHLNSQLLSQWLGEKYFIGPFYPWDTLSGQIKNISASGPTVTNTSIDIALFLGVQRIILLGVDLCFSPQGHTHASDSIERLSGPPVGFSGQMVITNNGEQAETKPDFLSAIDILGAQGENAGKQHCQMINPSPDAARIKNIDFITIEDIVLPEPVTQLKNSLTDKKSMSQYPPEYCDHLIQHNSKIIKELKKINGQLEKLHKMAKEGIKFNRQFFENDDPEGNFKYKIKMDKLEKDLHKGQLGDFTNLCIKFGIQEFLKFIQPDTDEEWTNKEIEDSGHTYYSALSTGISEFKEEIKNALHRTYCRLFEVDPTHKDCNHINIQILVKQWKDDQQPGRIHKLKLLNSSLYAAFSAETIAELTTLYNQQLENDQHDSRKYKSTSQFAALDGVYTKADELFLHQDKSGLQRLLKALKLRNEDEVNEVIHLVNAYLHELEDKMDDALAEYLQADSQFTLNSALKRVVHIALDRGELESAEFGLQSLIQISPVHMPQLAKLQRILGKNQDALNTYADYLEINPADINVMLKLGMLYNELEIHEGAEFIFKHILEQEPDNKIALQYLRKE